MELYQCPHLHHCHYHQDRHDHRHRHHDHCHHDHRHHDQCHHRHNDIDCSEEQGQGGFSAMQQNPALMQADFFLFDNLDHADFYFDIYHTLDHLNDQVSCRHIFSR